MSDSAGRCCQSVRRGRGVTTSAPRTTATSPAGRSRRGGRTPCIASAGRTMEPTSRRASRPRRRWCDDRRPGTGRPARAGRARACCRASLVRPAASRGCRCPCGIIRPPAGRSHGGYQSGLIAAAGFTGRNLDPYAGECRRDAFPDGPADVPDIGEALYGCLLATAHRRTAISVLMSGPQLLAKSWTFPQHADLVAGFHEINFVQCP